MSPMQSTRTPHTISNPCHLRLLRTAAIGRCMRKTLPELARDTASVIFFMRWLISPSTPTLASARYLTMTRLHARSTRSCSSSSGSSPRATLLSNPSSDEADTPRPKLERCEGCAETSECRKRPDSRSSVLIPRASRACGRRSQERKAKGRKIGDRRLSSALRAPRKSRYRWCIAWSWISSSDFRRRSSSHTCPCRPNSAASSLRSRSSTFTNRNPPVWAATEAVGRVSASLTDSTSTEGSRWSIWRHARRSGSESNQRLSRAMSHSRQTSHAYTFTALCIARANILPRVHSTSASLLLPAATSSHSTNC
mmetsp:Transcript_18694/g.44521  ORF Transcript_18694/g.44521 Transcript_18694/m.44521 type:complete len:310 (-) Transcript_18694:64-993(-)